MIGDDYVNEDPQDAPTIRDKVAEIIWREQSEYIPCVDGTHYRAADEIMTLVGREAWDEGCMAQDGSDYSQLHRNPYDTP